MTVQFVTCISLSIALGACSTMAQAPEAANDMTPHGAMSLERLDTIHAKMKLIPEGVQIAIALIDGDSTTYYGFVRQNNALRTIENADSVFEIGSISKVMTAAILAQRVNAGQMRLDDAATKYLDFSLKGDPKFTLRHLACHTAGLPRLPTNMVMRALLNPDNPYADYDEDALREYLQKKLKLEAAPGERYAYSNLGMGLLGYVLEKQSGETYEALLQRWVFEPCGMTSSAVSRSRVADRLVAGRDKKGLKRPNWDMGVFAGAGAVLSTVRDLTAFARSQCDPDNPQAALMLQTHHRHSEKMDMGLAWHLLKNEDGRTCAWHNGGTGGYRSSLTLDVARRKGVVVLSNLSPDHAHADAIDQIGFALLRSLD